MESDLNMLLRCPFCGSEPEFPAIEEVYGTCYDAGCNDCGVATISIQIIDCFDYGESPNREDAHNSWDEDKIKYGDSFIKVARDEAIKRWNTRAANTKFSGLTTECFINSQLEE